MKLKDANEGDIVEYKDVKHEVIRKTTPCGCVVIKDVQIPTGGYDIVSKESEVKLIEGGKNNGS